jgi:hypothetical protein
MTELLLQVLYISLFCLGLHTITSEGMVLFFVKEWLSKKLPENTKWDYLYKPIIGCPPCMASIWGTIIYWILNDPTQRVLVLWIPTIIAVSYVNKLLITDDDR